MPLQAGEYDGLCTGGAWVRSSNDNPGFQVFLQCKDGNATFTIWLRGKDQEKTKEKAAKNLRTLGATDADMRSAAFLNYQLPLVVKDRPIRFGVAEEEYEGHKRMKVIWIGPKRKEPDPNAAAEAAAIFGGNGGGPVTPEHPATDEDIPF